MLEGDANDLDLLSYRKRHRPRRTLWRSADSLIRNVKGGLVLRFFEGD